MQRMFELLNFHSKAIYFKNIDDLRELLSSDFYKNKLLNDILPDDKFIISGDGKITLLPEDKVIGAAADGSISFIAENDGNIISDFRIIFLDEENNDLTPLEILHRDHTTLKLKQAISKKGKPLTNQKGKPLYLSNKNKLYTIDQIKAHAQQIIEKNPNEKLSENKIFNQISGPLYLSNSLLQKYSKVLQDKFAEQLIVASNGETYWLDDILDPLNENMSDIPLRFQNKKGDEFSIAEIKNKQNDPDFKNFLATLIHNQPLAQVFCTVSLTRQGTLSCENNKTICPITKKPAAFPVITPSEDSYEWYAIDGWMNTFNVKEDEDFPHPSSTDSMDMRLLKKQLIPNEVMESLFWIRFEEDCKEKEKTKIELKNSLKMKTPRERREREIWTQYKEIKNLQLENQTKMCDTLQATNDYVKERKNKLHINPFEEKYEKLHVTNPSLFMHETNLELNKVKLELKKKSIERKKNLVGNVPRILFTNSLIMVLLGTCMTLSGLLFPPLLLPGAGVLMIGVSSLAIEFIDPFLDKWVIKYQLKSTEKLKKVNEQIEEIDTVINYENDYLKKPKLLAPYLKKQKEIDQCFNKLQKIEQEYSNSPIENNIAQKPLSIIEKTPIERTRAPMGLFHNNVEPPVSFPPSSKQVTDFAHSKLKT